MAIHRSAMGKTVDMSALSGKNEKVRAVGNMNVNARGDVLDSHNRVVQDNTQRVKAAYQNTVTDTPPHLTPARPASALQPDVQPEIQHQVEEPVELSEEEQELFGDEDEEETK
jgi:hypothetical protein